MVRHGAVLRRGGGLAAFVLALVLAAAPQAWGESQVGLPAGEIAGEWVGLLGCPGVLREITLTLSPSGRGATHATVNLVTAKTIRFGTSAPASVEMTGEYDERTGRLDLAQYVGKHRTANQLTGVIEGGSGRLVAWPKIPRILASGCGPAVLGRGDFRSEVKRLEGAGARWPKDMKKFDKAFEKARRKYKPEKLCNEQMTGWLEQFSIARFGRVSSRARSEAQLTIVNAVNHLALHDSGFRPHFGKGFAELRPKELGTLAARAEACRNQKVGTVGGWNASDLLHRAARNRGGMDRVLVLTNNLALDVEFGWQRRARARLDEIPRAGAQEDEIDAIKSTGELVKDALWPEDRKALNAAVITARAGWAKGTLMAALTPLIQEAPQSVAAVERLAGYTRDNYAYRQLNATDRAEIDALVKRSVDESVVAAVQRFAAGASGGEGVREMANWRDLHSVLWETMDPTLRLPVREAFAARFPTLVEAVMASERERYEHGWDAMTSGVDALAYAVKFEKDFSHYYAFGSVSLGWLNLRDEPAYRAFAAERAERRGQALVKAGEELKAAVDKAETVGELDRIADTYMLPADRGSVGGGGLASAISSRRKALTPFRSYRGGAYLDALYQEDRETLEELDADFRAPYVRLARGMSTAVASPFFSMTVGTAIRATANKISLIGPVIAAYLLNYPTVYERCLEPDADTVERRISREWVSRDLFGNSTSTPLPDIVHHYKVNKRFTDVFMKINADYAPGAGLIDVLMKAAGVTGGAIGTSDVGLGVTRMMQDFPCDGPVIARFEKKMLRYFYE